MDGPDHNEIGRKLFQAETVFVKGVVATSGLPEADRPEIAFAGRSNVGKSSLINALTGRKAIARTSNTPGRTQELNFFALESAATGPLYMVDMPGYGFAKAPLPKVEAWQRLIKAYLRGRVNLARVFVLIDARHGIKPVDEEILSLLDGAAVSYQIVLTKADKVKAGAREALVSDTLKALAKRPAAYPEVILTSSEEKTGLEALRATIAELAMR
ncbi:MAG: ribosome biogenesis GTP-binding protein YihA/YsxC [Pseudomonadota bacterium]